MGVIKNVAFKAVMKNHSLFHIMVRAAAKLQLPATEKNADDPGRRILRHLPLHFMARGYTEWRNLPGIAETPFRDQFDTVVQKVDRPRLRVGFFVGCGADFV